MSFNDWINNLYNTEVDLKKLDDEELVILYDIYEEKNNEF